MVSDNSKKSKTRSGLAYLKHVFDVQNECEEKSSTYVEKQDSEILTTLCNLDSVMLMLDRVGSCYWGCNKGDHITERLLAKTVGFASAALRLANFGHY